MADKKYLKFFIGTVIKLTVFLVLCIGARFGFVFAPSPVNKIAPFVFSVLVTCLFLFYIEGNKRSFLSKGYMVENIVTGGAWGIGTAVISPVLFLLLGDVAIVGFPSGFDPRESVYAVMASSLFLSVVIFGYFFHIIQYDFGAIPAVVLSSVVFAVLMGMMRFGSAEGIMAFDEYIASAVAYIPMGIVAGMLILNFGDMRSAAAFLSLNELTQILVSGCITMDNVAAESFMIEIIIMIGSIISLLFALRKRD